MLLSVSSTSKLGSNNPDSTCDIGFSGNDRQIQAQYYLHAYTRQENLLMATNKTLKEAQRKT